MNSKLIEEIANAVLYEGYMLYPYRPSAVKNRQRWNFGVLYPKSYSEAQKGIDAWIMQTQCLCRGSESTVVDVKVRFLQAIARQIGRPQTSTEELAICESLEIGSRVLQSWQEAIERDAIPEPVPMADLLAGPVRQVFTFPGHRELEPVEGEAGSVAAYIVRTREEITACVEIMAAKLQQDVFQLTVLIKNLTSTETPSPDFREHVLLRSLLSTHTILRVTGGEFISLIDPPPGLQEVAGACQNIGTWPVLVGEESAVDAMLSTPIILYDYPQIASESPGDLFDGTEIDEILSLRILTLTDQEKSEIRQADDRARKVLERTETMPREHFLKLHGVLRTMKPFDKPSEEVGHEDER